MTNLVKHDRGTGVIVMSTELNGLPSGSRVIASSPYDNTGGELWADFELFINGFGANPTAATVINLYAVCAPDGTNYGTGDASNRVPNTCFLGAFDVNAQATQRLHLFGAPIPPYLMKLILDDQCGQAFPNSGNTLKLFPRHLNDNAS